MIYTAGNYVLPVGDSSFPVLSRQTAYLAIRLLAAILAAGHDHCLIISAATNTARGAGADCTEDSVKRPRTNRRD